MRAIWKGHIRFSLVTIPIRMYSAIENKQSIHFRQLHQEDNGPIGYSKVCKVCQTKVSNTEIVKGFEYEPDQYVIIEDTDLEKVKLKSTKVIDIEAFVDASEVDLALYDSPYFAGPDGEVAAKAYSLLGETLSITNKLAIGRVVLRDKENIVLIAPTGQGLMMYKLRYPDELRNISEVPLVGSEDATDEAQLKLAQTLVDSMTKAFTDLDLKDRYREAVMEIVNAKVAGEEIISLAEEETPTVDIMSALQESIAQSKTEKKPLKKATGKHEEEKEDKEKKTA